MVDKEREENVIIKCVQYAMLVRRRRCRCLRRLHLPVCTFDCVATAQLANWRMVLPIQYKIYTNIRAVYTCGWFDTTSNVQSPQPLPMSIIQLKIEWMNFEFNFVGRMTEIWHFCRQSHWNWGANESESKIENTDVHYTDVRAIHSINYTPTIYRALSN